MGDAYPLDDFVLPDGSTFDLEVGLGDILPAQRFQGYGTFLSGVKSRLHKYGRRPKRVCALSHIGAEVGDDEIGISTTPEYPAAELVVFSEFLGVKVSEEDTSINCRFGNYAEDLVIVPDGYEQTYHYASATSDFKNMAFLDVPKLRLAIDVRPGRLDHSSTNDGKAGMLGARLAWLPRNAPVRCLWEVFNLYQDLNLGLLRDKKFAYLPTALGGYGKPIPFGKAENFEAFASQYRQGTHAGLARELVRRTNRRFEEYTLEHRYNTDEVLSAVSRLQSSWHDWIKGKSLYAPTCWLEAPPEVASYRVGTHGTDVVLDSAMRRLQSEGYLVAESDLAIAYEHNQLCSYLLQVETHEEFKKARADARAQWLNNSTFSMRLYGYLTKLGVDQNLQNVLESDTYRTFVEYTTKRKLHLRSFLRQEVFYDARAKDAVYMNGPMKVTIPLYPTVTQQGRRFWFEQTRDTPNEREIPEEYNLLLDWVKNPIGSPPKRTLLEDDPILLREISVADENTAFCIVTDDIQLCREAYMSTRKWIIRVPCLWYYMDIYYGDASEPWLKVPRDRYPFYKWETLLDTGSIEAYEEIGFKDGLPTRWPRERPFNLVQESIRNGRRLRARATSPETLGEPWEPYRFPDGYLFAPGRFLRRNRHPHRRGWA